MKDSYLNFVNAPPGARLARTFGLPKPEVLRRYRVDDAEFDRIVVLGAGPTPELLEALDELGVVVMVHNAGITQDKTIAKMTAAAWRDVLDINLGTQQPIDHALLAAGTLRDGGRIVCVSSINGIAGNRGQANYAASKTGVIGRVQSMAPRPAARGITINAVAPGFIETQMTAEIPLAIREAGRRMNSMSQGGQPVDVARAIAWLAHPGCAGITGQVVCVCGQSLIGA